MKIFTLRNVLRTAMWGGIAALGTALVGVIVAAVYVVRVTADLPDYQQLAEYEPPVMSRVHAGDGRLIAEYAREHRVFVPIENIPQSLVQAFISAEDKNFYEHGGLDFRGIIRAAFANIRHVILGERLEGASTITQQVAKNFLLSSAQRLERKVQEMVLARRIERAFTKDQILELYLNEIYFGQRAYGAAAAALNYFDKSLDELTLDEAALLAAVVNGPARFHPIRHPERTIDRRNWVLSRMAANGYITEEEAREAAQQPLEIAERLSGDDYLAAEYFVENVRRQVFSMYGDEELYHGGLSIRTTLDTTMQLAARQALRDGLETYDRRHGYRGALGQIELEEGWETRLEEFTLPRDLDAGWMGAVVLSLSADAAEIGFADGTRGSIPMSALEWGRETLPDGELGPIVTTPSEVLSSGDVILVESIADQEDYTDGQFGLRQIPAINGAIMAMDPHTGRVLAMMGGYSFQHSQFNRATQARRQPGSSFKPFAYAAALDNGYTPASLILDAPFIASGGADERFYMPSNYAERYYGMSTLRLGLELSRNVMTVRLAQEMGMRPIADYGERFGIYDELSPVLAMSLGAGETTLHRLVSAYATLVNGGRRVEPTILDRVQDRTGATIFAHEQLECGTCDVEEWTQELLEPWFADNRMEVVDPVTAYQVVHMLEGAVQRGTGTALRSLGRPMGGKTGTTNDFRDAWFVGFSPDLIVGVYVGFDTPYQLGSGEAGGRVAAPIARDFFGQVIGDYPVAPFRVPEGVRLVPIDRLTGEPGILGQSGVILEAFRPGSEPSRQSVDEESGLSFATSSVSERPQDAGLDELLEEDGDEEEEDELGGLY
ncbi:MAG: penicillin-binding protein 1A [Maricaulis sp.]|jgi:penicillin-binding protein 1A|uniref:penicillin-binding protein 1A n=1 Tax=Maricaulis sp. TaxID=1486257 RepID=UPI001B163260|nr:penicillin-binding protein 1A [Maricaulis sp.]MBO6729853.1 penicillin-binding protein 1A [Maricaulis sp.]MBO6848507.1 penicillin-binding protein 1A [Maricaulis sp.]MBO6878091.1 penicillin-binding protein 1A [Maricaulis sp.]